MGVSDIVVRRAADGDAPAAAGLSCDFNREFDEPAPAPDVLAARLRELIADGGSTVLLAGSDPVGVAVLGLRKALWSSGLECYLAELYVVPAQRGQGIGRALVQAAIREAPARGAETMDIGVDEPDCPARGLYEATGFSNRVGAIPGGPVMFVYERDL